MGRFAARPSQFNRSRAAWRPSQAGSQTRPYPPLARDTLQPRTGSRPQADFETRLQWRSWPVAPRNLPRRPPPVPQPETHSLKEALEAISRPKDNKKTQGDERVDGQKTDSRRLVRFNFQASSSQSSESHDGTPANTGQEEVRAPHWPEIRRSEDEKKVVKRAPIRRRPRMSRLGQALQSSEDQSKALISEADSMAGRQRFPSLFTDRSSFKASQPVRLSLGDAGNTRVVDLGEPQPQRALRTQDKVPQETPEKDAISLEPSGDLVADLTSTGSTSLILKGLSPSLQLSDFMRFVGSDLSSWSLQIDKITQRRHRYTLEPLDSYQLHFPTSTSTINFVDALKCLQSLSKSKVDNASEVPINLAQQTADPPPPPPQDQQVNYPKTNLRTNTVTPPSLRHIQVFAAQGSPGLRDQWEARMESFFSLDSDHDRPPLVLVDVHPCAGYNFSLKAVIQADGKLHEDEWNVGDPKPLRDFLNHKSTVYGQAPDRIMRQHALVKGRYIIRCASIHEARRFHRSWNKRVVPWARRHFDGEVDQDHVLTTSIVQW